MLEPIPNTGVVCSGAFPSMTMPASGQLAGQQYVSGMFVDAFDRLQAEVAASGGKLNASESQVCLCSNAISAGCLGETGRLPDFCGTVPIQYETTSIPRGNDPSFKEICSECEKKDALIAELTAKVEAQQAEIRALYESH